MKIVYGHDIPGDGKDPTFAAIREGVQLLTSATLPGTWLVNSIHSIRHLPEWFPGCQFHQFARETKEVVESFVVDPYERAKKNHVGRFGWFLRCMILTCVI